MNNPCVNFEDKTAEITTCCYYVIQEKCYDDGLGEFQTHGIKLVGTNFEEVLHDVSICCETATWIAEMLNLYQSLPCHFRDVVEDLLP